MERHQQREARVVPVILRDCDWDFAPFSKLQALPKDGKPVAAWANRDEAFKNIALGIRSVAEELNRRVPRRSSGRAVVPASSLSIPAREYLSPVRDRRDLMIHGPRLKILFGPPILGAAAPPPYGPEPSGKGRFLETDALLDMGAGRTVLAPEAVRAAGLPQVGETMIITVGGRLRAGIFAASLQFPRQRMRTIDILEVCCCELSSPLFRCLVGRDVLSRWILAYDGPVGTWQISERTVDSSIEPPEGSDLYGG